MADNRDAAISVEGFDMTSTLPPTSELDQFMRILQKSPQLAEDFERISAYWQGKGSGASSINHEVAVVLAQLKRQPAIVIDVGGNIGEYTSALMSNNKGINIHIFEPSSHNVNKLESKFGNDHNITINKMALSDKNGTATLFYDKPGSRLASLTNRRLSHFNIKFNLSESISTMRFEEYWVNNLHRAGIDIVKIDIEGHELFALQGFGKSMQYIRIIQFEFGGCNIDTRTYFQDFWYFFKEHDFDILRITPRGSMRIDQYRESDEFFSTTNYIAANRRDIGEIAEDRSRPGASYRMPVGMIRAGTTSAMPGGEEGPDSRRWRLAALASPPACRARQRRLDRLR